ncbi:hypothetical protein WQE_21556 [Paraburkholderia hospita]|uniref:Uncharacterized protein n=1 Tax=Paraburkholderia hospita TaxID=169430 RepID=A0ABP2PMU5_9BURK|nr:hypothetical protein WQE_21556 [Paraburkholderia hospita]
MKRKAFDDADEPGRGFAVGAAEVCSLARRSSAASVVFF